MVKSAGMYGANPYPHKTKYTKEWPMKKIICTCDLCGKPIESLDSKYVKYKVKVNKTFRYVVRGSNYITYDECRRWHKIDCHKECVDKLFGFIISAEDVVVERDQSYIL